MDPRDRCMRLHLLLVDVLELAEEAIEFVPPMLRDSREFYARLMRTRIALADLPCDGKGA